MYIDSYQAKLKQALNSLFHAMKAEIDWERDPREKEALRLGEREPSRYLIGHRFNDMTGQLVKEASQACKLDHPNFTFHPRFHEGLQVAWVRRSNDGENPVKWAFQVNKPTIYECGLLHRESDRFFRIANRDIPPFNWSSDEGTLGLPLLEIETLPKEPTAGDDERSVSGGESTIATWQTAATNVSVMGALLTGPWFRPKKTVPLSTPST
jgi:hypothetical protein